MFSLLPVIRFIILHFPPLVKAEQYDKLVEDAQLQTCTDLSAYLEKLIGDTKRYQILISVRGDGAAGLSQAHREQFAQLGFTELAELPEGTHYAGVSDGGRILADETAWEEDAGISFIILHFPPLVKDRPGSALYDIFRNMHNTTYSFLPRKNRPICWGWVTETIVENKRIT